MSLRLWPLLLDGERQPSEEDLFQVEGLPTVINSELQRMVLQKGSADGVRKLLPFVYDVQLLFRLTKFLSKRLDSPGLFRQIVERISSVSAATRGVVVAFAKVVHRVLMPLGGEKLSSFVGSVEEGLDELGRDLFKHLVAVVLRRGEEVAWEEDGVDLDVVREWLVLPLLKRGFLARRLMRLAVFAKSLSKSSLSIHSSGD